MNADDITEQNHDAAAQGAADAEALIAEGKRLWSQGRLAEALSRFNEAAETDTTGTAEALAEHARGVLAFRCNDFYNP